MRISDWSSDVCSSDLKVRSMILKTCPPLPWTRWSFALPRGMRPCGHAGRAHEKGDRSPRHEQPAVHLGPAQHAKPFSRSNECGGCPGHRNFYEEEAEGGIEVIYTIKVGLHEPNKCDERQAFRAH